VTGTVQALVRYQSYPASWRVGRASKTLLLVSPVETAIGPDLCDWFSIDSRKSLSSQFF